MTPKAPENQVEQVTQQEYKYGFTTDIEAGVLYCAEVVRQYRLGPPDVNCRSNATTPLVVWALPTICGCRALSRFNMSGSAVKWPA